MKFALVASIILIGSIANSVVARMAPPTVTQIVAGDSHTCALFSNRKVKCWGSGSYGQIGSGNYLSLGDAAGEMGDTLPYVNLGTGVMVDRLIGGDYMTCAITSDAKMKCWGYGGSGGLLNGLNTTLGDNANEMGDALPYSDLGTDKAIKQADGGYINYCAIFEDSKMKCWGYNYYGQLGLGDTLDRGATAATVGTKLPYVDLGNVSKPMKVSAGRYHTCALFENGKIKCWGYNGLGELGYGDTVTRGNLANQMGNNLPFVDLGKDVMVTDVVAGELMTCVLIAGGKVKCWGNGSSGLGYGDTNNRGDNPNEMGDNLPFVDLGDGLPVTAIAIQLSSVCATFLNGTIKCWGGNNFGTLGYGDTQPRGDNAGEMGESLEPVYLGRNAHVEGVVMGAFHGCAAISQQAVFKGIKCWGYNNAGQLGLEHLVNMGSASGQMNSLPFINLGNN
ncbi:MAG: hypothetical protein ABL958_09645 [Bdellovibrionia bacterium]